MKKIEKLDKYFITPKPRFYGGFKYDGEDIFLCDDIDTDDIDEYDSDDFDDESEDDDDDADDDSFDDDYAF